MYYYYQYSLIDMTKQYRPLINSLIHKMLEKNVATSNNIIGCNIEEILELERKFKINLPLAYKEILLKMGKKAGILFNDGNFFYKDLFSLKDDAQELLIFDNSSFVLPENIFVFALLQSEKFWYFICNDDNPQIFSYTENQINHINKDFPILSFEDIFDFVEWAINFYTPSSKPYTLFKN